MGVRNESKEILHMVQGANDEAFWRRITRTYCQRLQKASVEASRRTFRESGRSGFRWRVIFLKSHFNESK